LSLILHSQDFVLSYAKHGELLSFIEANTYLPVKCAKFYAAELVLALEYLHHMKIIHRWITRILSKKIVLFNLWLCLANTITFSRHSIRFRSSGINYYANNHQRSNLFSFHGFIDVYSSNYCDAL